MDHTHPYPDAYIREILTSVKTIALVGASPSPTRPSHGVLKYLDQKGYDMIPVNPRPGLAEIAGIQVCPTLASIERPVDMVDVFRKSADLMSVTREAIEIGAKVLWAQLGVFDPAAAKLAEDAGLRVVMNKCPKIEINRLL